MVSTQMNEKDKYFLPLKKRFRSNENTVDQPYELKFIKNTEANI